MMNVSPQNQEEDNAVCSHQFCSTLVVLVISIHQEKQRGIKTRKEVKLSIFYRQHDFLCRKPSRCYPKKLMELRSKCGKISGHGTKNLEI
jgi:hypothetical protein